MSTVAATACSTSLRWLKFSFVGAFGIGVQLAALWALTRFGYNYLIATGLAVETTVIHNFVWHQNFTWSDRCMVQPNFLHRFFRFHVSNGLISLIGKLILMHLLVGGAGFAVLPANLMTVSACWFGNFLASDRWVFLLRSPDRRKK